MPADRHAAERDMPEAFPPLPGSAAVAQVVRRDRHKPTLASAVWRFGIVGVVGTVVNLAALWLLYRQIGLGFTRSSAIATEVAIIGNYVGNELWTFHLRRFSLRRFVRFNLAALAGLVATVAVATAVRGAAPPLLAQLTGIAAGAGLNFALNFAWTWRR